MTTTQFAAIATADSRRSLMPLAAAEAVLTRNVGDRQRYAATVLAIAELQASRSTEQPARS